MLGRLHGGIGRYVFELASRIPKLDGQNFYFLFFNPNQSDPGELSQLKKLPNTKLVNAKFRHYSFGEQTLFLRLLNKFKLDLIHFPNFNVPIFYKRPFVVTIHDVVHHKISGAKKSRLPYFLAYKRVITTAIKKSKNVITVSEASKEDIQNYFKIPSEKIKVIYEASFLSPELSQEQASEVKDKYLIKRPYFLFVGVLERKKNITGLTKGFDNFLFKYKYDMDLVIAGKADPHYPEIKFQAMEIKHKDRLIFTGGVDDEDLAALYQNAFAFVSASLHEGFGLPGVEALTFGLPLIVSNIKVFNEIYDNAAIYFEPNNPADIAEKMNLLVNDGLFYNKLQEDALKRSLIYSWENTARETINVYNQII